MDADTTESATTASLDDTGTVRVAPVQCFELWEMSLDPDINKGKWTRKTTQSWLKR
jgi:hypothetical protein